MRRTVPSLIGLTLLLSLTACGGSGTDPIAEINGFLDTLAARIENEDASGIAILYKTLS